jgi:hypothetical protein
MRTLGLYGLLSKDTQRHNYNAVVKILTTAPCRLSFLLIKMAVSQELKDIYMLN